MYKLAYKYGTTELVNSVIRVEDTAWIPYDPANTDYINFKAQINDESTQLETPEGTIMTPEEAKSYVATLP